MREPPSARRVVFLLIPNYSMIAFSCAIEPLRMANWLGDATLYEPVVASLDGKPVRASNGLEISPCVDISEIRQASVVFVCGGVSPDAGLVSRLKPVLQEFLRKKSAIGGICTGSYLLAKAGLLNGYRCTVHWENISAMYDEFPQLVVSSDLFELDRDRFTCSGGSAPLDMMLTLIGREHGGELATAIAEMFVCERIRGVHDRQRIPLKQRFGSSQPKLIEAVELMEANIEEPMSLDELSNHVGISRRQLERLFQKHLNCVPTRYYLELRLRRARELLLRSTKSIVDIAFSCGFVSAPHFSKCYRDFFKISPREERRNPGFKSTDATEQTGNG
ncbi:MAG: GlxA family transcriptional regulator [Proteobacteria bacterium]|nr:MAG: GlxA family transcriptional regulator [Pseudomonadota bacterium]